MKFGILLGLFGCLTARKRPCEDVFKDKDGKPRSEVTIRMEVDVNTLLSVNVNKLLEKANLLGNSRSKNFAIKDVTPSKSFYLILSFVTVRPTVITDNFSPHWCQ